MKSSNNNTFFYLIVAAVIAVAAYAVYNYKFVKTQDMAPGHQQVSYGLEPKEAATELGTEVVTDVVAVEASATETEARQPEVVEAEQQAN